MVKVLTSHHSIWHPEQAVAAIIKEYQTTGQCTVDLNDEGPCADTIGLYRLLDYVCETFAFDCKNISVITANLEEHSAKYNIKISNNRHWFAPTIQAYHQLPPLQPKTFTNLFGCLYNVPSWDRLCLLSYVWKNSPHPNTLTCNGTWQADHYNTYYLNTIVDHAPAELINVAQYLNTDPRPALTDTVNGKPLTATHMMQVWPLYTDFFVDIVAETYNMGLSFFCTEKTLRPMLALTPFIINAPCGYLSVLRHDFGFQTFSEWWNEDYDNFQGYQRLQKIHTVIDFLNNLQPKQWQQMYTEMLPILKHNQQHLLTYEQRR